MSLADAYFPPEQRNIIASALAGVQLPSLTLGGSEFGDSEFEQYADAFLHQLKGYGDGVFEQIMLACLGVERLALYCETDSQ
jgi:hypothetical protein